jgi:hypothetical protein
VHSLPGCADRGDTLVEFVNPYAIFMQQGLHATLSHDAISGAAAARQMSAAARPRDDQIAALAAAGAPLEAQVHILGPKP